MVTGFTIEYTSQFKRDIKRLKKQGKEIELLFDVLDAIMENGLEVRHKDHILKGEFVGVRECHISPDWVLLYVRDEKSITLIRSGTHQDIFKRY